MYVYIYIQYVHIFIYEVENGTLPLFIFSLTVKETYGKFISKTRLYMPQTIKYDAAHLIFKKFYIRLCCVIFAGL